MRITANSVPVIRQSSPSLPFSILSKRPDSSSLHQFEVAADGGAILCNDYFGRSSSIQSLQMLQGGTSPYLFGLPTTEANSNGVPALRMIANAAERLEEELAADSQLPKAVYISPQHDPFPPWLPLQREIARVVEVVAQHGIQAWLMTRGYIRPLVREVLAKYKNSVKVMLGITTLERSWQRQFEPLTAPPRLRLKQIRQLRSQDVSVQVTLEPLIPGLTDTRENLEPVLQRLADIGVRHITAGYLFLAPGTQDHLYKLLKTLSRDVSTIDNYINGVIFRWDRWANMRFLAKNRRQQGYASLMALAANYGISVGVSALSNPDFGRPQPARVFSQRRFQY